MKVAGHRSWQGHIRITVYGPDGAETVEFDNTITTDGHDLLVQALNGVDAEIKYVAWGDDNTAPAASDSALGNEEGRHLVTSQSLTGAGELTTTCLILSNEANDQIEELGWFAGASATASADSGVLVARVLYSRLKTSLESISVERTDTLS